jgi:hypothetical protein
LLSAIVWANEPLIPPILRIPPQRVLVAKEDEAEAAALIEPLKYPMEER